MKPKHVLPALALLLPGLAFAHKTWMLPSATVLTPESGITVDAAVSNDLFYFNHHPLPLDALVITAPDGSTVEPQNPHTGKFRSSFDLPLQQEGTYRLALHNRGLFASWEAGGQQRRWRGTAERFAEEVPEDAGNLRVFESMSSVVSFVTAGAPTETVFEVRGSGLEMVPETHPNDLYSGERARFRFLIDGKPAAGLPVVIVPGGTRYRDQQDAIELTTDEDGRVEVQWPAAGMYWLSVQHEDDRTSLPQVRRRRLGYTATLEVLPQ